MLKVEGLRFGYVPTTDIMKDVSFTIDDGEFIAVGGRNGCGKTTITRLLVGLEKPQAGRIFWDGRDITTTAPAERSRFIGYVFQQPDRQMFRPTVGAEVAFGPQTQGLAPDAVESIVSDVLERVGISYLRESYPPTLRRGEKQRVAIASALAMQSRILILDEPTSGQDGTETRELMDLLSQLHHEGLSIVLITHDMELIASHCTRAIIMGHGTKAFDDTPERLFSLTPEALQELGLVKPPCVALGEVVPGIGYCSTMDEFTNKLLAL